MYPELDNKNQGNSGQISFKKTLPPSEEMTAAVLDLRQTLPSISSFKPHLNTHECHLSLIVNNKISIPIKIVFFRNYPKQRPLIFVTQWIVHPIINQYTCQIEYQKQFPWNSSVRLSDLTKKIQGRFAQQLPTQDSQLDTAIRELDYYGKQVQSLRTKPPGTQPPQPPSVNLENVLKTFEYQENLYNQCEEKNALYLLTAQQYNQNISRVRCMSEKFGKGKILREMQKEIDAEVSQMQGGKISHVINEYYQKKKKLHKMKILKQLYLES